jgi:hypothetical protein
MASGTTSARCILILPYNSLSSIWFWLKVFMFGAFGTWDEQTPFEKGPTNSLTVTPELKDDTEQKLM